LRRGNSLMYFLTTARVVGISVSISSVNNIFDVSLCVKTNYYFYIHTEM
jgi:hypothetical protein